MIVISGNSPVIRIPKSFQATTRDRMMIVRKAISTRSIFFMKFTSYSHFYHIKILNITCISLTKMRFFVIIKGFFEEV